MPGGWTWPSACSQKGLMLPPGLGFNALSPRALEAADGRG